ncbi:hypothetical protein D0962_26815 [Leptolyngbyaceae cyanobacterium CCMR0082]|uniref:Uncharacterized protein n=1 Tax=Adonisia turfae CCMR0082 TaxID=2304604 RepID=A0A6M0SCV4_9CYAN|nr:hypothetical protein [Adonisia turfae]NEZ66328.1 hypothetical protein [Adonisia turfae CCMR0082]
MKHIRPIKFLSFLIISAAIVIVQLSPVHAFETPPGLESAYQQVLSDWSAPLLPAEIPFDFTSVETSSSPSHYLISIDINEFQTVAISAGNGSKRIDAVSSTAVQQIALNNQVVGYFLPAGETDEEPPELSFLIEEVNYYVGGWVAPEDLIAIANSMIDNR